ncbi:hypothetical protein ACFOU2_00680 [Bacillus songklensis]|uniref:Uncharacterized protein n=1 Tax=Bacillus songklensis TaxID=1069116 RepID=A0ABV8AVW2_9BACI
MISPVYHQCEKDFSIWGLCSLIIGIGQWILFMSCFTELTPMQNVHIRLALILLPMFIAPVGVLLAYLDSRNASISKYGLIINITMFLLPFVYLICSQYIVID